MNKIGVVERREECRQVGHNAPIKSQGGKRQRCEDKKKKKKSCKTDDLDEDRVPQGRSEGVKKSFQKVMSGHFSPSLQDTP